MLHRADCYARNILDITSDDVCFSVSKMFFAYGLGNSISFPLRFGASTVLLSTPPTPESVMGTLMEYLSGKLPKFKRPWGIRFVEDFPKTATGKIQRFKLRTPNK